MKTILRKFVPGFVIKLVRSKPGEKQYRRWKENGCPIPPPHIVKQKVIAEYQETYGHTTMVETGTYLGDMVEAQKAIFTRIYSIELSLDLFKKAQKRFKNNDNVVIVHGDSGEVLSTVLTDINEPAIFWLDGHYSAGITAKGEKDCPIFEELNAVLNKKRHNHILLIDDARLFIGKGDYPTIEKLTEYIKRRDENYQVEVKDDIIRYVI